MNPTSAAAWGRVPSRNTRWPPSGSHSPAGAPGFPVPARRSSAHPTSSFRAASPNRPRPAEPRCARSRVPPRAGQPPGQWPPSPGRTAREPRTPSLPPDHATPWDNSWPLACLHPLQGLEPPRFPGWSNELAQPPVVVEPGLVVGELVAGQDAGGGLAVFLAGPLVVGAVQPGRVGVAAAAGVAAAGHPVGEGGGERANDGSQGGAGGEG